MNRNDILDLLGFLLKLEYDAIQAYNQAIGKVDVPNIREQISLFRDDHERHVDKISAMIHSMGEEPPERSHDVKGFFLEGFTGISSAAGTESIIQAMETNENLTNQHYDRALQKDLPSEIRTQLEENFENEQRHLQYVEQALTGRIWEPSETHLS
jgi:rubrerythrin